MAVYAKNCIVANIVTTPNGMLLSITINRIAWNARYFCIQSLW